MRPGLNVTHSFIKPFFELSLPVTCQDKMYGIGGAMFICREPRCHCGIVSG